MTPRWRGRRSSARTRALSTASSAWPLRPVRLEELLRDLPDVAVGIGEAGGTHSPITVHRAVEQRYAALNQFRAHGIRVIHPDGELEPRPGCAAADRSRLDQVAGGWNPEQVDDGVLEAERRGVLVLPDHRHVEDLAVERLRPSRVFDEQRDGTDTLQRRTHFRTSFHLLDLN